jgi:hypothetical protein
VICTLAGEVAERLFGVDLAEAEKGAAEDWRQALSYVIDAEATAGVSTNAARSDYINARYEECWALLCAHKEALVNVANQLLGSTNSKVYGKSLKLHTIQQDGVRP